MESFIHVAAFTPSPAHQTVSDRPTLSKFKSLQNLAKAATSASSLSPSIAANDDRPRVPPKSTSTSQLPLARSRPPSFLGDEMSTLPDPRRTRTPSNDDGQSSPSHHPDLSDEVATLSTKLINAINHQTYLDDTLSSTRHQLHTANERIKDLEAKNASQRQIMSGEVWVRRSTLDGERKALQTEKRTMQAKLADETTRRVNVEREKKKIEQELENLTADLFEEANKMVVHAKEEAKADHQTLQRKNDLLKAQLGDMEGLLKSQQEQLAELKNVMETMASERDDQTNCTVPSSPGFAKFDMRDEDRADAEPSSLSANEGLPPSHPTSFHHLIQPVLRTDLASYDDFVALARMSRRTPGSRVSSGSMVGLGSISMSLGAATSSHFSNGSTSSLHAASPGHSSAPQSPHTVGPALSPSAMTPPGPPATNLKDTKFFKRALAEDVEPTLRLDIAPGLSWLARRSVITSMAEGSLVVEPVPATSNLIPIARPQYYPCSLCGESRNQEPHLRMHRFRTSEADSAQRYPLCKYCLGRVRATCDFLGFLRMLKDGHFRTDDEDQEKNAWEESVRLREQMFWTRIGGGVVPVSQTISQLDGDKSRRPSHEQTDTSAETESAKTAQASSESESKEGSVITQEKPPLPPRANEDAEEMHTPPEEPVEAEAEQEAADSPKETTPDLQIRQSSGSGVSTVVPDEEQESKAEPEAEK